MVIRTYFIIASAAQKKGGDDISPNFNICYFTNDCSVYFLKYGATGHENLQSKTHQILVQNNVNIVKLNHQFANILVFLNPYNVYREYCLIP